MALDMQPGAELGHTGVDADASPSAVPGDDASTPSPAVCAAYERAMRIATLLVGDQALAADVVADAVTSIRADQRRRVLRLAPGPELLRPLVLRAQQIDDELTHGEPTAPPPLVRASATDDDPFHAISHRDLRWALLALPMRDRAIVVLGALTDLDDTDLQRVLVLDGGDVASAAGAARSLLLDTVQVEAAPEQLDTAIGRAGDDLTVTVDPDGLAELLRHEVSWRERLGRVHLTRWGILAALLVGALVWLTTRDPNTPKVVVTPPPSSFVRPSTTAPTTTSPAVSAVAGETVGFRTPATGPATPASSAPATSAPTTATTAVAVDAASEERVPDSTVRPAATAPVTTPTETVSPTVPDTVVPTAPATVAPPATTAGTTAAPATTQPATTAPRPPATTAPPTTTAPPPPPTTAAPTTTTVAPTRLAISATTCRRTWFDVTFTVSGVTSPGNANVSLATPWGTYGAVATGQGTTATWSVQVTAAAWFPGPGPYGVTATAGGQRATGSLTCN